VKSNHPKLLGRSAASLVVALTVGPALAQSTTRVSVDSAGAQANGASAVMSISASGRFVAFESDASNLVAGDTNGGRDVFVRDRAASTTERVSISTAGAQANLDCGYPSISGDGRFVGFFTAATTLVAGDINSCEDVFVRDRQNGTTEVESVSSFGVLGNLTSDEPSISANGRFVAFHSFATNLVAGDTQGWQDIFVRDRQSATTERVSVDSSGAEANANSLFCSISADGRFVAFLSEASNLVTGDTNFAVDVFVHDRANHVTERVSVDSSGVQGNSFSGLALYTGGPVISGDGRFVAFMSYASNLVAADTNSFPDIFERDRQSGTTLRVSVSGAGAQANNASFYPSISFDGRYVSFESGATNLVVGDTSVLPDVFLRDRVAGATERPSVDSAGAEANSISQYSAVSADGRCVAFQSFASNLVAGDTNFLYDDFVRDRGVQPPSAYCTSGTSTHGCFASISASANPSVSHANACTVTVASVEGQKSGILFYGIDDTAFVPAPWAAGSTSWLCVKSPTQRTAIQSSGGTANACDGMYLLDWNAYQAANPLALGNPWSSGDDVFVQAWFRDPPAVKSTSLSNAIALTYVP
jgi:hypothetical protein